MQTAPLVVRFTESEEVVRFVWKPLRPAGLPRHGEIEVVGPRQWVEGLEVTPFRSRPTRHVRPLVPVGHTRRHTRPDYALLFWWSVLCILVGYCIALAQGVFT